VNLLTKLRGYLVPLLATAAILLLHPARLFSQEAGGEANLVLPDLSQATFSAAPLAAGHCSSTAC